MVGFDGSEMDDNREPSDEDIEAQAFVMEFTNAIASYGSAIIDEIVGRGDHVEMYDDGSTPGEKIIGVTTKDGVALSITISMTL